MENKRIQRKRTKGYKMPEGAIYVGRPTRWGNPFVVKESNHFGYIVTAPTTGKWHGDILKKHGYLVYLHKSDAIRAAVKCFSVMISRYDAVDIAFIKASLLGHDLACWCSLSVDCHADVLLDVCRGNYDKKSSGE